VKKNFQINKDEEKYLSDKFSNRKLIIREKSSYKKRSECGLLLLNVTETCNLRCKYCFAHDGSYNSSSKIMDLSTLKDSIIYVLNNFKNGIEIVSFFGGEPLIAFDNIREIILFINEKCNEMNLKKPSYGIITNGTLLTNEIVEFLNMYVRSITVSIDGNEILNDYARKAFNGESVYKRIKENLDNIKKSRKFIMTSETTITKVHIQRYKPGIVKQWMEELYELGFDSISFIPVDSNDEELSITDEITVKAIFKEYVDYSFELLSSGQYNRFPKTFISIIYALAKKEYVYECGTGTSQVFINSLGEIYPCQMYYQARKYKLGSIYKKYKSGDEIRKKIKSSFTRLNVDDCNNCFARNICSSWCSGSSILFNGNEKSVINTRCWVQTSLIENVIKNMLKLKDDKEKWSVALERIKKLDKVFAS
jgi:radical SAM protein with 4Fe4S-binding SPASM domain